MNVKKIITTAALVCSIFCTSYSAFAEQHKIEGSVVFEQAEIRDKDILLKRAKSGISDREGSVLKTNAIVKNSTTGELKDAKIYSTTQKLKAIQLNGSLTESFVTTSFAEILVDGSRSDSKYDESFSVRAYSTFYWNEVNINGIKHYEMINATGGWENSDSLIGVQNKYANLQAYGWTLEGGEVYVTQQTNTYPSSNSFNLTAPSTWKPILAQQGKYGELGIYSSCTVVDLTNNDTWELYLLNYMPQ